MKRIAFWIVVWFALMAFLSIIAFKADAAQMRGERASCEVLATNIWQAGDMRDSGIPWEVAKVRFQELLDEARQNPHSFVKSKEDEAFIMRAFQSLWTFADDAAIVIAAQVYKQCMGITPTRL